MKEATDTIPDLMLERFVAGELPVDQADRISEQEARSEFLAARIEQIRRSNEDILSTYPPAEIAVRIRHRAGLEVGGLRTIAPSGLRAVGGGSKTRAALLWALPAAAALAIGIGMAFVQAGTGLDSPAGVTRPKGAEPHLSLFRKTAQGAELLADGTTAAASDLMQIGYYTGARGYGVIFSIDGKGTLTFHLPEGYGGGKTAAPGIETSGETVLPEAYELDDAPRFERFCFVFSTKPFDIEPVAELARALAANPQTAETVKPNLPAGLVWSALSVKKGVKR